MSQAGVISARRAHMRTLVLVAMQNITSQHLRPHIITCSVKQTRRACRDFMWRPQEQHWLGNA